MVRKVVRAVTLIIFFFIALGIGALIMFPSPWKTKKSQAELQPRIIIPRNQGARTDYDYDSMEIRAREDSLTPRIDLEEGEIIVSVLSGNFDGGLTEKQFIAYRNLLEIDSPIYLTFIDYDEASRKYTRLWSAATAATRPGTVNLYTLDLLGDRNVCVLLSGVNGRGEHTLTVFRKNASIPLEETPDKNALFSKIAELRIDGSISINERARTRAYQMSMAQGESFTISGFGRDYDSSNILDQVEIIYAYNAATNLYEQRSANRIPGNQVEQRKVRELLSNPRAFEDFITGLWYRVTSQGTIDLHQYIYFNPPTKEIIFYGDQTQQVFIWQNSTSTRYGLYISSQNISVTTLRRNFDLELESLESIKLKIFEDVRLNIGVNASWDGSYRKAVPPAHLASLSTEAHIEARYDGSIGRIIFLPNGSYELRSAGTMKLGKYAFFRMDDQELLELRADGASRQRETFLVEGEKQNTMTLLPVRLGVKGIEKLPERGHSISLVQD
jgi:hypothetical protein